MTDEAIDFEEWSDSGDAHSPPPLNSSTGADKFHPVKRPPMALLHIFDDGRDTSETIRIRGDQTTIGRNADVSIAHDPDIADQHAHIIRARSRNKYSWSVKDLEASSGLFVRVKKAILSDSAEFLAGSYRYKFCGASPISHGNEKLRARLDAGSIPGQSMFQSEVAYPSIQRIQAESEDRLWLIAEDYWIGRDKSCGLCVPDDRLLADKHVQVTKTSNGWQLASYGVTNGFWVRMKQVGVSKSCTFQLGEQRFRLIVNL